MRKNTLLVLCLFLAFSLFPRTAKAEEHSFSPVEVDVLIDAGHGGVDGGAAYGKQLEKDITLAVARLLFKHLNMLGYKVALNRDGDYALSDENEWLQTRSRHQKDLAQRKHLAKALTPKIMISLHTNASKNPSIHGPIVFYQENNQSFFLADTIQHALNNLYKTSELPRKAKTLYLLNHSICPTALVEMGFLSHPIDRARLTDPEYQAQIVRALVSAIDTYFWFLNTPMHAR
ncbi:N-acetylmuramoyl-L-alanine amidase [Aneurinibacillus thermoaerophilus]|uniref:N-acetylmuramoyl-L-alanine amidase family protein n=1 Tax=Aneurinibacillus thermoaerophilus TaxID=143495 RepID=UPI002E2371D8|nr:N-acetylmuramoyl-L-alanine amidase [Aneurinibacillus thermoaerophilus]MED0763467.1 N-acetylmuramoyl-L-alanine amidase [Aneurinibacillus thermoaerophilus]